MQAVFRGQSRICLYLGFRVVYACENVRTMEFREPSMSCSIIL